MTAGELLVGVDVGSTHVKAALVCAGSGVRYVARRDTPTHPVPGGGAYHDPGELLGAVEAVIAECVGAAGGTAVRGIGVASMAEAGVPLDRSGSPLGQIVAWFDPRPARQAAELERGFTREGLFARTGLRPEPKHSLPKLMWLRAERPAEYARLWRWSGVAELVAYTFSGELTTNASLATRTLAFDPIARRWDVELLAAAGLAAEQLPEVVPFGRPSGALRAAAASRLGLPSGIPVAVAGHDHAVAGLGSGVACPGDALDSMGSAEAALLVTARPMPIDAVRELGFSTGAHVTDETGYVLGGLQSAGSMLEWFAATFLPAGADRYEALAACMTPIAAPAAVLARPYPRGRTAPFPDREATLEFSGIGEQHALGDLAAALVDGAAYAVEWIFEELQHVAATKIEQIRVTGGGTRNARWLSAKAALTTVPLALVRTEEAAALGAALVGGLASGVYEDLPAALADAAPAETLEATPDDQDRYRRAYAERWLPWASAPHGRGRRDPTAPA